MEEGIIAIGYEIPIIVSKLVFFILFILLGWVMAFMHIHIESSKHPDFHESFKKYRNSLTVRLLNFAVVTIFLSIVILFLAQSFIGDGYYYDRELLEPFTRYGDLKDSKCIICAMLFILAKYSMYLYGFIYFIFFKSLSDGRVSAIALYNATVVLRKRIINLRLEEKTTYEFINFREYYNFQILLRILGIISGILILYFLAYFFCNVIVYKALAVKVVHA